jgi:putative ABC transport system permease protein
MRWVRDLIDDIRFAVRGFARNPVFCVTAVLTVALGIGANTAVFTLAQKIVLQSLPVHRPDQLVAIGCIDRTEPEEDLCNASWPGFQMYVEGSRDIFSGLFAYSAIADLNVVHNGEGRLATALLASGSMYEVLGVNPLHGRLFTPADDERSAPPVAVLSHAFWQEHFGGDAGPSGPSGPSGIVGQTVSLNNKRVTIVGVTPAGFSGVTVGEPPDVTLAMGSAAPLFLQPNSLDTATDMWLNIIGRRKDGVSIERVQATLTPVFHRIIEHMVASAGPEGPDYRESVKNDEFRALEAARGGFSELRSGLQLPLRILMVLVTLVLLIACANLASLFLSRAEARRHEMAVRLSLGAGRLRIARQFWTESLLLAAIGGSIGMLIAQASGPMLLKMASGERALRAVDLSPDPTILIFTGAVVVLSGLLIGAGPALGLAAAPAESLRASRATARTSRLGRYLVPAQVMLALLLMAGAGLFVRSLDSIRGLDLGYRSENLISLTAMPDRAGYVAERRKAYWRDLIAGLEAQPGVQSVTLSGDAIGRLNVTSRVDVPGFETAALEDTRAARKSVGAQFVKTAGLKLRYGSDITTADADAARRVAVVNESFSKHFFQSANAVGRQFSLTLGGRNVPITIVGVVGDARDRDPKSAPERVMYVLTPYEFLGIAFVSVRTASADPNSLSAIRAAAMRVDPVVPIVGLRTTQMQLDEMLGRDRLLAMIGTFFGGLALLLVAVGLYGLLAGGVARRTREIGVRIALGAFQERVVWLVVAEGLKLTVIGLIAGLGAALVLARYARSLSSTVDPADPLTLAAVAGILIAIAFLAALIPARRAARIDPVVALNQE